MGARALNRIQFSLERDVVKLYGRGTGAGAADMTGVKGKGLAATTPIDQTGTGLYSINLSDKWAGLLMFSANVIDPNSPDDWVVNVVSETVASTKKVNIAVYKGGALADLSTDEKLLFEITVSNSAQLPLGY